MGNARGWTLVLVTVCALALTGCGGPSDEAAPILEPDTALPTQEETTGTTESTSAVAATEKCATCEIDMTDAKTREAFISVDVAGDEYIYSYWRCKVCGFYALETYRDRSMGSADITVDDSITPDEGRAIVEAIKQCPDPRDEDCTCDTHQSMKGQ